MECALVVIAGEKLYSSTLCNDEVGEIFSSFFDDDSL